MAVDRRSYRGPYAGSASIARFSYIMLRLLLFPWTRLRFLGPPPPPGPLLLAVNHNSKIDPVLLALTLYRMGRMPHFLIKESAFRVRFLGFFLRNLGQIPVDRTGADMVALRSASRLLRAGQTVILYPEGTLTRDPDLWPMRGKAGAITVSTLSRIPITPAAQWGAQKTLPPYGKFRIPWRNLWRPRPIFTLSLGSPLPLSGGRMKTEDRQRMVDRVMGAITEQLAKLRAEEPPPRYSVSFVGQDQKQQENI